MKSLFLLFSALVIALSSCDKTELVPDQAPVDMVDNTPVDTTTYPLIGEWRCFQYKYGGAANETFIRETDWTIKIEKDTLRIDEQNDKIFEQNLAINMNGGLLNITYPDRVRPYEIRPINIGGKKGYDLICLDRTNRPDQYSLLKR